IEARDEIKWLQRYIDELKGKVDLTVALIHEGTPARQSSMGNTGIFPPWRFCANGFAMPLTELRSIRQRVVCDNAASISSGRC
ncbi:hypothetical protein MJO10_33875, partial [Salmonella enterica subsp. enterica serovar Anatum]|nr:hypothetical protein [Salmonella enterica subsp. enterica serovar Anatum]